MRVLPSIDLEGGRAVKRVRGQRGTGLVVGDPLEVAGRAREAGFQRLHVVDLDGAERGEPSPENLAQVRRIAGETGLRVQLGGGIRSLASASRACSVEGVDTLVVGTAWLGNPGFLDEVMRETGCRAVAAVEVRRGRVATWGWRRLEALGLEEALGMVKRTSAWGVLLTIIDVEGEMTGLGEEVLGTVARARGMLEPPRVLEYSGGIAGMGDLEALEALGVDYAILGMALHSGRVPWEEVARRYA